MPWVEFHATTIVRLQKFRDFRSDLSWSRHEALGFLGDLWGQVLELREDGDIRGWTPDYIAELTGLKPAIAARLWDALVKNRWVELRKDGSVLIHDWLVYAGRYLNGRYRTADPTRLAAIRAKHVDQSDYSPSKVGPPNLTLPPEGEHLTRACNNSKPVDKLGPGDNSLRKVGASARGGEQRRGEEEMKLLEHRLPFGPNKGLYISSLPVGRSAWLLTKWEGRANLDKKTRAALEVRARIDKEDYRR